MSEILCCLYRIITSAENQSISYMLPFIDWRDINGWGNAVCVLDCMVVWIQNVISVLDVYGCVLTEYCVLDCMVVCLQNAVCPWRVWLCAYRMLSVSLTCMVVCLQNTVCVLDCMVICLQNAVCVLDVYGCMLTDDQLRFSTWWCQCHHRERGDDYQLPTHPEGWAFGLRSLWMSPF